MKKKYDIAAYIWPAYTGKEMRTRIFWPDGIGEWQTVRDSVIDYPEHNYHWDRKPLWGYQDEADPKVMEFQIEEATKHGVNVATTEATSIYKKVFPSKCSTYAFSSIPSLKKETVRFINAFV